MAALLTEKEGYDIRYSDMEDGVLVKEWLQESEVRKWYPPSSEADVDVFVRNWIGFSRYKASLTALYEGKPIGVATIFLMPYIKVAHLCMMYMVVDPKFQRQGVGHSLIKNIKHLAKSRFRLESMHCELWDECPLIDLLKKNDFSQVIRQENFVKLEDGFRARLVLESPL